MAKFPGVFVVDQDPEARYQIEQMVPETGFVVSGQSGLGTDAVAQATDAQPDMILCAMREPLARVVQTIEALSRALPDTPVVAYSDSAELDIVRKAMVAGARDFLQSPIKLDELRKSLGAALEAEERRHITGDDNSLLASRGAIISVFGAKGGVGKTTIAANLAVALVRSAGQSCVLVDADDSFGDAAATLSLTPEHTLFDAMRVLGEDGADLDNYLTFHDNGLAVAAAPADPLEWHEADADRFQQMLHRLSRQFDVVLVDTSGTLGEISQAALDASSLVLWITTPDYASVRDSLQALQAARKLGLDDERIRLVLNEVSRELEIRPSAVEQALGMSLFWSIPYDRLLRRDGQLGESVIEMHPNSPAARRISDLSRVLSGIPVEGRSTSRQGLFGRLLSRRNGTSTDTPIPNTAPEEANV
jgi:pilus assembly protein CpaE